MMRFQMSTIMIRTCVVAAWGTVAVCLPSCPAIAAPQPGELLELKVATPRGPVSIAFRYCPPGQLLRGKPEPIPEPSQDFATNLKRNRLLATMKGFYISQQEVSQQNFEEVLGKEAVHTLSKRLLAADAGGRGNEFPVRGVNVVEAAKFCETLRALDRHNAAARSEIEGRRFRLPSQEEWQYACRAVSDPQQAFAKPHFNAWPDLNAIPKDVVSDCQDIWKELKPGLAFTGTQDQVIHIVENSKDPVRGVKILTSFLQAGLGIQRSYAAVETQPQPAGTGIPNAWNIFNMHGNVWEWVVAERDPIRLTRVLNALAAGEVEQIDPDKTKVFFLAGGGYNHALERTTTSWVPFCIWGGDRMKEGSSDSDPYSFAELEQKEVELQPGIRVVLERVLSEDWLLVIRESTVLDNKDTLDDIKKKLDEHLAAIAELATGEDLSLAKARVTYYMALATYRAGQTHQGSKILSECAPAIEKDDPYFSHLRQLVSTDAREQ